MTEATSVTLRWTPDTSGFVAGTFQLYLILFRLFRVPCQTAKLSIDSLQLASPLSLVHRLGCDVSRPNQRSKERRKASRVGVAAAKRVQIRTCTKHLYRHQGTQPSRPPTYTNQRIGTRQLVDGYAECFGTELAAGIAYLFGGECKAVIYTHSGCTLEISLALSP